MKTNSQLNNNQLWWYTYWTR